MKVCVATCLAAVFLGGTTSQPVEGQDRAATSGVIEVSGGELPYLIEGSGRPCLVYGSPVYYPRTFSARFKSALRCVHVAQRGFVAGATRRAGAPFSVPEAVADIETVRKELGMDDFVLVGHSIHGLVVLAYATEHPEHVTHVIAIGAPPGFPYSADSVAAYQTRQFGSERQLQHEENLLAFDSLTAAHPGRGIVASYVAKGALYWEDPVFDATPIWEGVDINDTMISYLFGTTFAWKADRSSVSVPAFIALGVHDFVVPPNLWSGLQTPFEDQTISVFDEAGHTPQLEVAEEFDRQVLTWLQRSR
jgi:proline iminopeptidase